MMNHPSADSQLRMRFYEYTAPTDFLLDMHFDMEIGVVCSGVMQRQYRGWTADLLPGQIWLCGMFEPHSCGIVRFPCRVLVAQFSPHLMTGLGEYFSTLFAPFWQPPGQRSQTDGVAQKEVLRRTRSIASDIQAGKDTLDQNLLHVLEILALLQRKGTPSPAGAIQSVGSYYRISKAIELAVQSRTFTSVSDAAAACAMGRNTFAGLFRKSMGMPFAEFAQGHRLRNAVTELVRTQDAPKEIAQRWGFTDLAHFHHCFRRMYGCTPGEYRKKAQFQILPE